MQLASLPDSFCNPCPWSHRTTPSPLLTVHVTQSNCQLIGHQIYFTFIPLISVLGTGTKKYWNKDNNLFMVETDRNLSCWRVAYILICETCFAPCTLCLLIWCTDRHIYIYCMTEAFPCLSDKRLKGKNSISFQRLPKASGFIMICHSLLLQQNRSASATTTTVTKGGQLIVSFMETEYAKDLHPSLSWTLLATVGHQCLEVDEKVSSPHPPKKM